MVVSMLYNVYLHVVHEHTCIYMYYMLKCVYIVHVEMYMYMYISTFMVHVHVHACVHVQFTNVHVCLWLSAFQSEHCRMDCTTSSLAIVLLQLSGCMVKAAIYQPL